MRRVGLNFGAGKIQEAETAYYWLHVLWHRGKNRGKKRHRLRHHTFCAYTVHVVICHGMSRASRRAREAASAALVAAAADAAEEGDASDGTDGDNDHAMPSPPPRSSQPQHQQPQTLVAAAAPSSSAQAAPAATAAGVASSSTRNIQIHIANRNIAAKEKAVWIAPSNDCTQLKDFATLVAAAVGPRWSDAAL
jgi:hypothetical protein